jgi:crossover junction endodeoxyribonuclease RuvC
LIILGIDPGFAITGYGVISCEGNRFKVLDYGVIRTDSKDLFTDRLCKISIDLNMIINKYKPDSVAVEELFFNKNIKTAIAAAHGRGVALLCAAQKKIDTYEYTPLQVKQAVVGYGRADKNQVQQMVKVLLNLPELPKPDDAADALAVAICHGNSYMAAEKV